MTHCGQTPIQHLSPCWEQFSLCFTPPPGFFGSGRGYMHTDFSRVKSVLLQRMFLPPLFFSLLLFLCAPNGFCWWINTVGCPNHSTFHSSIASFFADSVVCVGSVTDCTVSVHALASGCVLDYFVTDNAFDVLQRKKNPLKWLLNAIKKWPHHQLNAPRMKSKGVLQKWRAVLSVLFLTVFMS